MLGIFGRLGAAVKRVLEHFGFILASAFICVGFYPGDPGVLEFWWWYLGLVLMIPVAHDGFKAPTFAVPAVCGVLYPACCLHFGLTAGASVFMGGIVVWAIRRIAYRRRHPWEWSAILGIVLGFALSQGSLPAMLLDSPKLLIALVIFILCGSSFLGWSLKRLGLRLKRENVEKLGAAMKKFENDPRIPKEVRKSLPAFNQALADYVSRKKIYDTSKPPLDALPKLYFALDTIAGGVGGPNSTFRNELQLKIAAGQAGSQLEQAASGLASAAGPKAEDGAGEKQAEQGGRDRYSELEDQALLLARKAREVDEVAGGSAASISSSAVKMIKALRTGASEGDIPSFLKRYLGAALTILKDYRRLLEDPDEEEDYAAVQRARAVLARIAKAFEEELDAMQDSDRDKFEASLKAFEEFMNMNGH